jgi:hypothetical protein
MSYLLGGFYDPDGFRLATTIMIDYARSYDDGCLVSMYIFDLVSWIMN